MLLTSIPGSRPSAAAAAHSANPAGHKLKAGGAIGIVIHISVDGLRSDAVTNLGPVHLPYFYRFRIEGAYTDNARTDFDFTVTLPSHTCQLTGRGVNGPDGHNVSFNSDNGGTLEEAHGSYMAGIYDVVHDNGMNTGMYASKDKFDFLERSWNAINGSQDTIGTDNGRDKIDVYVNMSDTDAMVDSFISNLLTSLHHYSLVHFYDTDSEGHSEGWNSVAYYNTVIRIDGLLGRIFDLIDDNPTFGNTAIILTSDHGGSGTSHSDAGNPENYTIPLYVWGPGVPAGAELYWLNSASRMDPGTGRPDYQSQPQPIRNGDVANLALDLLGMEAVPGSTINALQDLEAILPGGSDALPSVSITSPLEGTIFEALDTIPMEASASTETGSITKVEFFANWIKLGEDSTTPFGFTWPYVPLGNYTLTARAVRDDSISATSNVDIEITSATSADTPDSTPYETVRVYPNPFRSNTRIGFSLRRWEMVGITVYDVLGRRVNTVYWGWRKPGDHAVDFCSQNLSPGLYFCLIRTGNAVKTCKLMIIR